MALPPPNYTQTPNVCFDEIFKTLKEGELRVAIVLIRQTFGWHKSIERISLRQLAEKSGMERKSVCRSLKSLIEKGLVIKKKMGEKGKERCYFSLVMTGNEEIEPDCNGDISEEELELLSNNSDQCPKVTRQFSNNSDQCPKVTSQFSNNSDQCPKDSRPVSLGHQTSVPRTPDQCPKDTNKRNSSKEKEKEKEKQTACACARANAVSAAAAPAASKNQLKEERSISEKSHEENEFPSKAFVLQGDRKVIEIDESDLYRRIIGSGRNFSADAIRYAWKALCSYKEVVFDWWRFFEGTAEIFEMKQKIKRGEASCHWNRKKRTPRYADICAEENSKKFASDHDF